MKPYENTQAVCLYGHFDTEHPAGYTLTEGDKLAAPWYYVYNNRKLLMYVDQNGPVKIQYQPPNGILVMKREMGETQSKWQVWIFSPDLNNGVPVSNFCSPILRYDLKKPEFTVNQTPEKAIYTAKYDAADVITELFMPFDKATVCMKTTVINKSGKAMDFSVMPALFPYVNVPQMVAWDLPEWYLASTAMRKDGMLTIHGQMTDPKRIKANNRSVTFSLDYDADAELELDMAAFAGSGNFFSPDAVTKAHAMSYRMADCDGIGFSSHQAVYAARYHFTLAPNKSKTFTQVVTVQEDIAYNEAENIYDTAYFTEALYEQHIAATQSFYHELFAKRSIKTENPLYDNFINYFAPLQMFWVCSLDRGWPSSMRGIRDASQDFIGMTPLDAEWTRQTIITMFEHQRTDGWMPRQISTVSRTAPHDMRYYCDGGAFLLELIHEYMTFTRDTDLLEQKIVWLNSDEESTVLEHIIRCAQFYLEDCNIGEHGLCKVWYGDWWDPMDEIGMEGRGESVTVTAQMVLVLPYLADMLRWLYRLGKADESGLKLADSYLAHRDAFKEAMQKHAYNKAGFFNGYFNDNGKWLLSECDPDGEKRVYLVSNAWALISGCATKEMQKSILDVVEQECFGRMGYNTKSKGYAVYVDKAGRVGNGTSPGTGPYNHAQSFWVRACCECGDAERAYKATRYILPIEESYAPVEKTMAPPYAITNAYSNSNRALHRAEFQFLSGTVSYVLRTVYAFFFGITFTYEGLLFKPCMPQAFGNCEAHFEHLGKTFTILYRQTEATEKNVTLNGKAQKTTISPTSGKPTVFFTDDDLTKENIIVMEY